jgi:hypothetical protein
MMEDWVRRHAPAIRDEQHPMRPFRILDRVLLGEFLLTGAQTREALVQSAPACTYELSPPIVVAWMESARKRGFIVRRAETRDVEEQPLPMAEWELTSVGRDEAKRYARAADARQIIKVTLALVALVGSLLGIARALGFEELPNWTWILAISLLIVLALLLVLAVVESEGQTRAACGVAVTVLEERGITTP